MIFSKSSSFLTELNFIFTSIFPFSKNSTIKNSTLLSSNRKPTDFLRASILLIFLIFNLFNKGIFLPYFVMLFVNKRNIFSPRLPLFNFIRGIFSVVSNDFINKSIGTKVELMGCITKFIDFIPRVS